MSTSNIRRVLSTAFMEHPINHDDYKAAMAEVEAIEKAAPLLAAGIRNLQYGFDVQDGFDGACAVLVSIASESEGRKP